MQMTPARPPLSERLNLHTISLHYYRKPVAHIPGSWFLPNQAVLVWQSRHCVTARSQALGQSKAPLGREAVVSP
jgi:hypothetical protein